jgi:predicted small lipoprotein YifL
MHHPILTRAALVAATSIALGGMIAGCGSKGDLVLPRAGAAAQPPAAASSRSPTTTVPIQPAIPAPPAIRPETTPPPAPKQP